MRERYGMVRGREALLPIELVVQGDLSSLQLGAFPRLRPPKTTPDAVLYRDGSGPARSLSSARFGS